MASTQSSNGGTGGSEAALVRLSCQRELLGKFQCIQIKYEQKALVMEEACQRLDTYGTHDPLHQRTVRPQQDNTTIEQNGYRYLIHPFPLPYNNLVLFQCRSPYIIR